LESWGGKKKPRLGFLNLLSTYGNKEIVSTRGRKEGAAGESEQKSDTSGSGGREGGIARNPAD